MNMGLYRCIGYRIVYFLAVVPIHHSKMLFRKVHLDYLYLLEGISSDMILPFRKSPASDINQQSGNKPHL